MGFGPSEARGLSIWEYEAMLHEHNAMHDPAGPPVPFPKPDRVRLAMDRLGADPRFTGGAAR